MKKVACLIGFMLSGLVGQSITDVDFEVLPGNLIEVSYVIHDREPHSVYHISLYASLDGGFDFPVRARSVTGDVGNGVRGTGRKVILWKVLEDVPALVSDNLVLKVVGKPRATVGGFFRSLVAGNRFTKRMSNGLTFYGGRSEPLYYGNPEFRQQLDQGALEANQNLRFGLRITGVPFVYRLEGHVQSWGMSLTPEEALKLKYLSYGHRAYDGSDLSLFYEGFTFMAAYTPLPIFGIMLPQIGGGVALNRFRIGDASGSVTSTINNPGIFAEAAVQLNMIRWLKVNVGFRQTFFSPMMNTGEAFAEIGLHIPTR